MNPSSVTFAELIEPTLFAIKQAPAGKIHALLEKAQHTARLTRQLIRQEQVQLHMPSYELGVANTFVEILGTAAQRSVFNDAIRELSKSSDLLRILHEVALIERLGAAIKQNELADRVGMNAGNFSRKVNQLLSANLVQSQRLGRGLSYSLTPLGQDILNDKMPGWKAVDPESKAVFANEDSATDSASRLLDARLRESTQAIQNPKQDALLKLPKEELLRQSRSILGLVSRSSAPSGERPAPRRRPVSDQISDLAYA